jgi:hypothetical protein
MLFAWACVCERRRVHVFVVFCRGLCEPVSAIALSRKRGRLPFHFVRFALFDRAPPPPPHPTPPHPSNHPTTHPPNHPSLPCTLLLPLQIPLQKLFPPCPGDVNCVVDLAVHDDGKHVAVVTVSGSVTVFSSDFAQTFVKIDLRAVTAPVSAAWFGRQFESHGTLAVAWAKPPVLMLCDMASGVRWVPVSSNFLMVPEIDGLRVVNKQRSVFLQRTYLNDAGKFLMQIYESARSNKFAGGDKSAKRMAVRRGGRVEGCVGGWVEGVGGRGRGRDGDGGGGRRVDGQGKEAQWVETDA